ncbi:MAG TPA: hypothetical protein VFA74_11370 [Terriglobales bacterium]|nr:hypothetical protein [Terriglobales bacterium]
MVTVSPPVSHKIQLSARNREAIAATEGSKMHLLPPSADRADNRSEKPMGFANGFSRRTISPANQDTAAFLPLVLTPRAMRIPPHAADFNFVPSSRLGEPLVDLPMIFSAH